jgi:hypothetical protein
MEIVELGWTDLIVVVPYVRVRLAAVKNMKRSQEISPAVRVTRDVRIDGMRMHRSSGT